MSPKGSIVSAALVIVVVVILVTAGEEFRYARGFSARSEPTSFERFAARQARRFAVPQKARDMKNPLPLTPELLVSAREHFADHCALCHGNDGRGQTTIGRNLYPKAPDMILADTQDLSDGELFYAIKNGIRLTGMPAWGQDTPEDDRASWELVHLIRHLPKITPAELRQMKALNPISPREIREQMEEDQFLEGVGKTPAPAMDRQALKRSPHHEKDPDGSHPDVPPARFGRTGP
jgi:mono/diheme cytochrome c family protein